MASSLRPSIVFVSATDAWEAQVIKAGKKSKIKVGADGKLIAPEKEQGEKEEKAEGKKGSQKTKKP